ncbi:phosphoribosylglycinamide formyltransferase [Saccharibacter sp. 17.LH.SD]|uniref:phosphoribosylglycinamide formyltransferase n=1 Tax=Saccharibacter sp. 17.LH.SD TaxID=2689393 RepID=UPI00136EB22F|nr:phosphoribosylglycinamide formyltransferase [Saccharibacter sp. 17.LH.SD]MXV44185.1 phosphoribosylglycinamide formyltransferase [Saccharibacter sp. 17.LH.SD]
MPQKTPIAVLISGRGSNMTALMEACSRPDYPARISLVLSNRPDAIGLKTAHDAGLPTLCIDHKQYGKDRRSHEKAVDEAIRQSGAQLVCLAGYMRVLTPFLVQQWQGKMLNIHPSLLPAFPGLHTHEAALKAGVQRHGCTIHLVTDGVDEGPILAQASVPVLPDDTAERLAARVLEQEHQLYPRVLADYITKLNLA